MFLLQMAGVPGSGKSTLAEKIRMCTNSIIIDRDVVKSSMLKAGIKDPLLTDTSYLIVFDLIDYYLSKDLDVIVDTSCYLDKTLQRGLELSKKYGADYKYIECRVDNFDYIEERIKSRKNLASQLTEPTLEKYNSLVDKSLKPKNKDILIVNTTLEEDYKMEDILGYLYKNNNESLGKSNLVFHDIISI